MYLSKTYACWSYSSAGKGENIWDRFCHEGGNVANNDTGDVTCDSYNKYTRDVEMLKELKVGYTVQLKVQHHLHFLFTA